MALYSYKGAEPTVLPTRLKIDAEDSPSGERETRTHLDKLSDDELKDLGFIRVDLVEYDHMEYSHEWNSEKGEYDIIKLDRQEKIARQHTLQPDPVANWADFEERFPHLEIYKKIFASEIPFLMQFICETRIMLIYARFNDPRAHEMGVFNLQQGIDILSVIEENGITQEDRDKFLTNMKLANLDVEINIPDEEWREHHSFELNTEHLKYHKAMWGHYTHCLKADSHNIGGE